MPRKKNFHNQKKAGTSAVADSQTIATGSSVQAPSVSIFLPPATKHHGFVQAIQGGARQQSTRDFWVLTPQSKIVGPKASKYSATPQAQTDFYTIGLLLPNHLSSIPLLLKLFPDTTQLIELIEAIPDDKMTKLLEKGLFQRLESLKLDQIIGLVTRHEADTLSELTRSLGVPLLVEYDELFSGDETEVTLDKLVPYKKLLNGMPPAKMQLLVQAFGTAGLDDLQQVTVQQLKLLAAEATVIRRFFEASDIKTYLDHISVPEFLALCTAAEAMTVDFSRILKKMEAETIYDLARLPKADIATVATCLYNLPQVIGWQEVKDLGGDGVAAYLTAIEAGKLVLVLKQLKNNWTKWGKAELSFGTALRILITTKSPQDAATFLEKLNGSAQKLHAAALTADTFTNDRETLEKGLRPALFKAFTDDEFKRLLQGMTALEVINFVVTVGTAKAVKALLKENIRSAALKKLTGAYTKTLLKAVNQNAATVKELIQALPDELNEVVKYVPLNALTALLKALEVAEFADFVTTCGVRDTGTRKGLITLEATYTAESLNYYGHTFFQKFKGVTDDTMSHTLEGDGIKNDKVSGCHDRDNFMALDGEGITITANRARGGGIYEVTYTVEGSDAAQTKTLIDNLSGTQNAWQQRATKALDNSIRNQTLEVGGRWSGTGGGYTLTGYYGGKTAHVADTFWVQ